MSRVAIPLNKGPTLQTPPELIDDFLVAEKRATRFRWVKGGNPEFVRARSRLKVENRPELNGTAFFTAHLFRFPYKYSFLLSFKNERVLALDVEPGRSYRNIITGISVSGTHWQTWPLLEAETDARDLPHKLWFFEFVKRAKVCYPHVYKAPPFGQQLRMPGLGEECAPPAR